jgi:hypothetical protein
MTIIDLSATVQLWVFEIRLAKAFMQYTTSALGLADDVA